MCPRLYTHIENPDGPAEDLYNPFARLPFALAIFPNSFALILYVVQSFAVYVGIEVTGLFLFHGVCFCYSLNKLLSPLVPQKASWTNELELNIKNILLSSESSLIPEAPKSCQQTFHTLNYYISWLNPTHSSPISEGSNLFLPLQSLHTLFSCLLNPFIFSIYIGLQLLFLLLFDKYPIYPLIVDLGTAT